MESVPFLSIIIPAFNEHHTLTPLLRMLYAQEIPISFEIVIVDDGSNPSLFPCVKPFLKSHDNLRFFRFKRNSGKGSAVKWGMAHANGKYLIIQDADLEYRPMDIPALLFPIMQKLTVVVYGSRFSDFSRHMTHVHNFGNRLLTQFTNLIYHTKLTDMETGYKLFPRSILQRIKLVGAEFDIELEITAKITKLGYQIKEVPIHYAYRNKGQAKISVFDGLEAFYLIFYWRYFENNLIWLWVHRIFKIHLKPLLTKILRKILPKSPHIK